MKPSIRIFSIRGIEVAVHVSFLLILALLIYAFYVSPQPYGFSGFSSPLRFLLAFFAALFLFVSIFFHELAHSLVAMRYGVRVRGIVLFIFGGLSMMEKIPENPRQELMISIAGPLTSLLIGVMCAILTLIPSASISAFFTLSAYINLFLAVFNLIPAFPMDGGRIFRSFLARKMSYARATRVAAETGKMLAVMMGIFGIFYSPWLILIAFFIYIGANEEEKLVMLEKLLGKYRVSDIMTTEVITVNPSTKVGELIELMLKKRHLGYPVVEDGKIVGIVTLQDVINVNPEVEVREVMTREIVTISPSESAFQALKLMNERRIGRLPVVENGKLVGIISRSDLMRVAEILETLEVLGWKSPKSV
jgi:Zn-dependent protease